MTKGKFSEIFRDESNVKSSGYEYWVLKLILNFIFDDHI